MTTSATIPPLHTSYFIAIRDQLKGLPEIPTEVADIILSAHAAVLSTFTTDIVATIYSVPMPDPQLATIAKQVETIGSLPPLIATVNDDIIASLIDNKYRYREFVALEAYLQIKGRRPEQSLFYLNLWMGIGLFTIAVAAAFKSGVDSDVQSSNVVALTNLRSKDVVLRENLLHVYSLMLVHLENL